MEYRSYDAGRDREAAHRIWRETGWLEKGKEEYMDLFLASGRPLVADVNGEAECLVTTAPGTIRYLKEELPFSCVTAVTTSRVARKQGLAKRLTAAAVARDAAEGALVCGLGTFEQGYYDQLGFGTGGYEHHVGFHPSRLKVSVRPRVPRRLSRDDWELVHASRLARFPAHGRCNLTPPGLTRAEMLEDDNAFGLGYADGPKGELTHHLWCRFSHPEGGPYHVCWMAYRTAEQLLELMGLIKSLGDQVHLVTTREPPGVQLQDLLDRPFMERRVTEKSPFECTMRASAYWQMRICDVRGCLAGTWLPGTELRFNLRLTDPMEACLGDAAPWRGVAGGYVVSLGPSSGAEAGADEALPRLSASVGAFTRMWLGVRPATTLAVTDDLSAPRELLEELDWALRLPDPRPDWDF